ncbi:MAG: hypothetical protein K2R98_32615 [Gemmataceae bacterium]|nr:hypothetical protein [Gemmataceae bacterium]
MIDDVPVVLQSRHIEMPPPPLVLPPTAEQPPPSQERIQVVDQAFAGDRERADAIMGFVGLWLSAPWLGGLLADHFRVPEEEDDDPARMLARRASEE